MPSTLTDRAKSRNQGTDNAPVWVLKVGPEDYTDRSEGLSVSYGDETELTFDAVDMSHNLLDERVTLWLGYGDKTVPYFAGKLKRPAKGSAFFSLSAKALGLLSELSDHEYMSQQDYRGRFIGDALYDTFLRADNPRGTIEVSDPRAFRIDATAEEAIFTEETKLSEGLDFLLGTSEYVAADVPGTRYGRTIALPRPRPSAGEKAKAVYTYDHYSPGGFKLTPRGAGGNDDNGPYSEVIVFRRDPDGSYPVYAKAPVHNQGLKRQPKNRPYRITDFAGDQAQGKQTAYDTARTLAAGEQGFDLDLLSINPELARYDRLEVERLDYRPDGTYEQTWACLIEAITANVAAWAMPVSGGAVLAKEGKIAAPRIVGPSAADLSALRTELTPSGVTASDTRTIGQLGDYRIGELN